MNNIGVVYCVKNISNADFNKHIKEIFPNSIKDFLLKNLSPFTKAVYLKDLDVQIHCIQFPITIDKVNNLSEKAIFKAMGRVINKLRKNECSCVILDRAILKNRIVQKYFEYIKDIKVYKNNDLYLLLITETVQKICKVAKVDIHCLGVGIVIDNLDEKISQVINRIVTDIRFMHILSLNQVGIEEMADSIYDNTGLAISWGRNVKKGLKECDIIINFSNNSEFINSIKFPDKAVIINFGNEILKKEIKGIIINDLCMYSSKMPVNIHSCSDQLAFCQAFIETGKKDDNNIKYTNELKKLGYTISGFIGRNGKISLNEINNVLSEKIKKII